MVMPDENGFYPVDLNIKLVVDQTMAKGKMALVSALTETLDFTHVKIDQSLPGLQKLALVNAAIVAAKLQEDADALVALADIGGAPLSGNVPEQSHVGAPGETLAEGAAHALEAQGFKAGPGGGFGHNAHVKTPQGAKLFKEPIGSLIIPHPHPQGMAEHAVNNGTHHYVQAGEHTYAVHNDADVHVPKDTDLHDEGKVKNAPKTIVGKHEDGGKAHATITSYGPHKAPPTYPHEESHEQSLSQNWKKLPKATPKKPVSVKGKHAGWVPHDWTVYKDAHLPESGQEAKWAKDPEGGWHLIGDGGPGGAVHPTVAKVVEQYVASGEMVKDDAPHPPVGAVPHMPKEGAEPAKANIGGVNVSHDEIKSAIAHLSEAKSTNVKTPLKVKGHPLADMDYMAVSKAELKAHPELKVNPGTKQKHVGQVKLAVLHHLHAKAAELAKNEAEHSAAAQGLKDAKDTAEHAQKLTPSIAEFPKEEAGHGTMTVTVNGVAHEVPAGSKIYSKLSNKEKNIVAHQLGGLTLKYAHAPNGDWYGVTKKGVSKFPPDTAKVWDESLETGYMVPASGGKETAKAEEAAEDTGKAESGATAAEEDHTPEPEPEAPKAAPVGTLKSPGEPVSWGGVQVTTDQLKQAADWLEETKSSQAGFKAGMNKLGNPMAQADYMGVAKAWKAANPAAAKGLNTKQLMAAHVNDLLADMDKADEETGHNVAAELHAAVEETPVPEDWHDSAAGAAAKALKDAAETGHDQHVTVGYDGKFDVSPKPEADVIAVSDKHDNLKIVLHMDPADVPEETYPLSPQQTLDVLKGESQILDSPPKVENGIASYPDYPEHQYIEDMLSKIDGSHVIDSADKDKTNASAAIARSLWLAKQSGKDRFLHQEGAKWLVKNYPDTAGSFAAPGNGYYHITTNHVVIHHYAAGAESVLPGHLVAAMLGSEFPHAMPQEPETPGGTIPVWQAGIKVGDVPAGSKVYTGALVPDQALAVKHVKFPDGSWHEYSYNGFTDEAVHAVYPAAKAADMESHVKNGVFKELAAPEKAAKLVIEQNGHTYDAEPGTTQWKDKAYPDLGVFLREPDGTILWWPAAAAKPEGYGDSDATMTEGILDGSLIPHGKEAEEHAKALGAAKDQVPVPQAPEEAPKPEPEAPPVPKDITVTLAGGKSATVPATSKVYWAMSSTGEDKSNVKYVKHADGSWSKLTLNGYADSQSGYDHYVDSGYLIPSGTEAALAAEPEATQWEKDLLPEESPDLEDIPGLEDETPGEEKAGPTAFYYNHSAGSYKPVGEFPPGSKLYVKPVTPEGKGNIYAKAPDGAWYFGSPNGVSSSSSPQDYLIENGSLTPFSPTPAEAAKYGDIASTLESLKTSAVPGPYTSWQQAAAAGLTVVSGKSKVWVYAKNGAFFYTWWDPHSEETWQISVADLDGAHTLPGGATEPISFADVKQVIADHVVPNAVHLAGSVYKHGFYYKSDKAKAYLEIKASQSYYANDKALYIWHDTTGGTKEVTKSYASSFLASGGGDHYHAAPKPAVVGPAAVAKVEYATTGDKPASYTQWDYNKHDVSEIGWKKHPDGSISHVAPGGSDTAIDGDHAKFWDILLGAGNTPATLVDQYQNSVVSPGVKPSRLVVLGAEHTPEEIKEILGKLEKLPAGGEFIPHDEKWTTVFTAWHGAWGAKAEVAKAFIVAKAENSSTAPGHKDAIQGLLRELLAVPEQPHGTDLSGGLEPKFLKGLPPGIHTSKDVFTWTGHGYAKPFSGTGLGTPAQMSSLELADKIKAVSADFGGGKVVGTHPASLAKGEKAQWLEAWKTGDMKTVFALDAKGGKVSPAHPGAPDNVNTHSVAWAPWDPSQVPASKDIEGNWTPMGVVMSKEEADNYLIKAGLKHAEYLIVSEKKQWVAFHRQHDQEKVDALSKTADDRWQAGGAPLSSVPAWTDDIKPSKSYDAFVDDAKPLSYWTGAASADFAADHKEELAPFFDQYATEYGYGPGTLSHTSAYHILQDVIQRWMDAQKAKLEAEQSVPVWTKTPGTVTGGTHEIYELTKTIPLTGAKSQWMFKPAQNGQKFIAEQEHHATQLANMWGFKTPASQLMEFNGTFGQAQARLDALSDLSYGVSGFYDNAPIPWKDFTARQVSDIAREHLLDWALDNNDARASNFLAMPDGSIVGIDKGAAWKNFGKWDGLAGDKKADVQSRQVSTALYDAIRAHDISKDVADKAYVAAIQRARKMEKLSDDGMRVVLEQAFANRTDFGAPGSREALIKASIDRKNKLSESFGKLWGRVYKDAGWKLPEVPEQKLPVNKQGVQLHSGFSDPDFLEHVAATKSAGTHAFFGGTELDHAGFTVWKEFEGHGDAKPVVWGESTAVGPAYDKLVEWAVAHQTANHGSHVGQVKESEVKGEKAFYDKIIMAAKTISHHAADKNYNQDKVTSFNTAVTQLQDLQAQAEALIGTDKEDAPFMGSSPANVADMAKYYQRLAEKVNEAKDKGGTFKVGDLPRWEAPPSPEKAEEAKGKLGDIKVELTAPYRPGAHVTNVHGYASQLDEGHQLHVDAGKKAVGESSNVWKVTLPTGEEIEFSNGAQHGVEKAFYGRLRFRSHAGDATSMENIKSALQMMGLNMKEAEEHDLELHYWRHLGLVLADRVDGRDSSSKYAKVWDVIKSGMTDNGLTFKPGANNLAKNVFALEDANLAPEQELGMWRQAWATVTSTEQVGKFTAANGHLPHLHRQDVTSPDTHGGIPFWYRFDMDSKFLAGRQLPAHHFYAQNKAEATTGVVHGGALLSAEERLRYLGMWLDSNYGNPASYGATKYVFLRLNKENWHEADLYVNPKVLARTSNYAFEDDSWGNVDYKSSQSYFDPAKSTAWSGQYNETMVDATVSLLDDIEILKAKNESQRSSIIDYLKSVGVTEIRGVPVEQRIVTSISAADIKKIHAAYEKNPDMLDTLADVEDTSPTALTDDSVTVVDLESAFA